MVLTADIKYKNNFQQGALKGENTSFSVHPSLLTPFPVAKRRNKWICALKSILGDLNIYGPKGNPSPPPGVTRYAQVPWEIIEREDQQKAYEASQTTLSDRPPTVGWNLSDKNAPIRMSSKRTPLHLLANVCILSPIVDDGNDVFGDASQVSTLRKSIDYQSYKLLLVAHAESTTRNVVFFRYPQHSRCRGPANFIGAT